MGGAFSLKGGRSGANHRVAVAAVNTPIRSAAALQDRFSYPVESVISAGLQQNNDIHSYSTLLSVRETSYFPALQFTDPVPLTLLFSRLVLLNIYPELAPAFLPSAAFILPTSKEASSPPYAPWLQLRRITSGF